MSRRLNPSELKLVALDPPPPDFDDGEEKPLASIPLSQLMANNAIVCPVCGNPLPLDTKEVVLDGGIYQACKKDCGKK